MNSSRRRLKLRKKGPEWSSDEAQKQQNQAAEAAHALHVGGHSTQSKRLSCCCGCRWSARTRSAARTRGARALRKQPSRHEGARTSCWRRQGSSERCAPSSPWPLGAPTRSLPGTRRMGTTCWRRCGGSTWTLPRCPDSDHQAPGCQLCACHCTEPAPFACARTARRSRCCSSCSPVCASFPACLLLQLQLGVCAGCFEGYNSCLCLLPDGLTIVRRRDCGSGLQRALSAWQQPLLQGAAACGRHLLATPCGLRY